jgi:thiol-disulfide isomerase/thioredoxin
LKEPLFDLYNKTKERIENPKISMDAVLKKLDSSSINQIMDSILFNNKGKVIYLDCWATWCGPCRSEMPNSKKLMKQMDGKEITFVYLCIDSEEKLWKTCLDEFQLGGQHYFLSKKQSSDLRRIFEVNGIPHYFLFDKNGTIVEKGSHLRPDIAKGKIEELLKKK